MKLYQEIIDYAIEASIDPILICDKNEIRGINHSFLTKLGYETTDQILNQPLSSFIKHHFLTNLDSYSECTSITEVNYCQISSDCLKKVVPVYIKTWYIKELELITIAMGKCGICDSIQRNITNESVDPKSEDSIHENIIRELSSIMETMPCMILYFDSEQNQILTNRYYKKYLRLNDNENLKNCVELDEAENFQTEWDQNILNDEPFSMVYKLGAHPDRTTEENIYRWHIIKTTPIKNGSLGKTNRWITTITDIHDMKEIEEEKQRLITSEKLANEESKMKSEFLGVMSHELRTPLFGVIGSTNLLLESKLDLDQKSLVENINRSSQLLLTVISDILEFSRIECGQFKIRPQEFYLIDLFKDIEHVMNVQACRKDIALKVELVDFPYQLIGDRCRLLQVLINLTSNAIKFTNQGSVTIKFDYSILDSEFLDLTLKCIDTGVGISQIGCQKVFNKWEQLENKKIKNAEGSGLGLFICNSIISLMEGEIGISSEESKGTEVWVKLKLPYKRMEPLDLNSLAVELNSNGLEYNKKFRVLIAEDNPINQKIIVSYLKKIGQFDIKIFENGKLALAEFLKNPIDFYDLVILDQLMPEMSGTEVCQNIRNITSDLVVLLATANPINIDSLDSLGFNGFITKPFTIDQLRCLLKKWLPNI